MDCQEDGERTFFVDGLLHEREIWRQSRSIQGILTSVKYNGLHLSNLNTNDDEVLKVFSNPQYANQLKRVFLISPRGPRAPDIIKAILQNNPKSLQKFTLRPTIGTEDACIKSATATSYACSLQDLTLFGAIIAASALQAIALLLGHSNCSLKRLCIESVWEPGAAEPFSKGLSANRSLTCLDLSNCRLRDSDLKVIVANLPPTLKQLELVSNYCRSDTMAAITAQLLHDQTDSSFPALESINLTNQHPGEYGGSLDLSLLGLAIPSNSTLQHLDVSFNLLTTDDIRSLIAALSKNTTLKTLNLMSNQLDDGSMKWIGQYLPRMKGLQSLSVQSNRFGEDGANALLQGLVANVYLTTLSMPRGFAASESIDYLLALNQGGRRLLIQPTAERNVPMGLWALILARVYQKYPQQPTLEASVLFHMLQGQVLFGRSWT